MSRSRVISIGVLILAALGGVAHASVDLRVKSLEFNHAGPFAGYDPNGPAVLVDVVIGVEKLGPDSIGSSVPVVIALNGSPAGTQFLADSTGLQSFVFPLALGASDHIEVTVDPDDLIQLEISEENNALGFVNGDGFDNPCDPYPKFISFKDPDDPVYETDPSLATNLVMGCPPQQCSAVRTSVFPFAFLLLPPYDLSESRPDGLMRTGLTQTIVRNEEHTDSVSVTAGIAIEVEQPPVDIGAKIAWGGGIEASVAASTGVSTTRTRSQHFETLSLAAAGPTAEAMAVVTQTDADRCVYNILAAYNSERVGKKVTIAPPQTEARNPEAVVNPKLYQIPLSDYQVIKAPDAVGLVDPHIYGVKDNWPDRPHAELHVDKTQWIGSDSVVVREGAYVSSGGASWSASLESGDIVGTEQELSVNLYQRAEIGGVSVESSFGASNGTSHTIYEGFESGFEWEVGGVLDLDDAYTVIGYASNVEFIPAICPTPPLCELPSGHVLMVDYTVVGSQDIPTLSEWALLALGLLIGTAGITVLIRRA